jgi:phosphomethylpyrimidine synthase
VRDFAAKQNQPVETFVAADEAEKGMQEMAAKYNEGGRELYIGVGDREHD